MPRCTWPQAGWVKFSAREIASALNAHHPGGHQGERGVGLSGGARFHRDLRQVRVYGCALPSRCFIWAE